MQETYLVHHGIKGMKWGVRRTPEQLGYKEKARNVAKKVSKSKNNVSEKVSNSKVKQRIDNSKVKQKMDYRKNQKLNEIEGRYKDLGYAKQEAKSLAEKEYKAKRALAIAAVATATVAGVYFGKKYCDLNLDKAIKPSMVWERVHTNSSPQNMLGNMSNRPIYAAMGKDVDKYVGLFGKARDGSVKSKVKFKFESKAKIAGRNTGMSVLQELLDTDRDFRNDVREIAKANKRALGLGSKQKDAFRALDNELKRGSLRSKKAYDAFNIALVAHGGKYDELAKKFYDKLKQKGYSGVKDSNDMLYSGFGAKSAAILFGKTAKMIENRPLSESEVHSKYGRVVMQDSLRTMLSVTAASVLTVGGTIAYSMGTRSKNSKKYVEQYRAAHPNSKLSDKKILETHYKQSA